MVHTLILSFVHFFLDMAKNPKHSKDAAVTSSSMTFDEASKILNCPKNPTKEELLQVHK